MKVKDLIKELQNIDPETDISFMIDDGCCSDYLDLEAPSFDLLDYSGGSLFQIRFPALDLMRSCISSGVAHRAVAAFRASKDGK